MAHPPRRRPHTIVSAILIGSAILAAEAAIAQQGKPDIEQTQVLDLIPGESIFVVERRGHQAVRGAFEASNLGQILKDEALLQFVQDSRVKIGKMIVKGMFDLADEQEIARHQHLLHELLLPFWYNNCAGFALMDGGFSRPPKAGFVCRGGKYKDQAAKALEALMAVGVPQKGKPGKRQAFTYTTGSINWQGVAKQYEEFTLSDEAQQRKEQLESSDLFLAAWAGDTLLVALGLPVADALGKSVSAEGKPLAGAGISAKPSLQAILQKAELKDWAFRWFVDVAGMLEAAREDREGHRMFSIMGLDSIRGVGGTCGYADKVFARATFIDAPKARGVLAALKADGSYKTALAMSPRDATFCLAGQLDKANVLKLVRSAMVGQDLSAVDAPVEMSQREEKLYKQIQALADLSGGSVSVSVLDLQSAMMGGGFPLCATLDVSDQAKASAAIDDLLGPSPAGGKEYRKAPIRVLGHMAQVAVLKDRVVLALNDAAMTAAIDAALDNVGGFEEGSKAQALATLAGEGAAIYAMDLAALAKLAWPMLISASQQEFVPLASLPSTQKMVSFLGPELAVIKPQPDGMLFVSRGKIPLATKVTLKMAVPMMWLLARGAPILPPAGAEPPDEPVFSIESDMPPGDL